MLGKIEGRRRRGWQRMRWLDSITDSMDMSLSKRWEIVKDYSEGPHYSEDSEGPACCSPWGRKESDVTYQLNNNNKHCAKC